MQDVSPVVMYYVAYEYMGAALWALAALFVVWLVALIVAFARARRVDPRRQARWPGRISLFAGLIAAFVAPSAFILGTEAGFGDVATPADWALVAAIAAAAFVGVAVLLYPFLRLIADERAVKRGAAHPRHAARA